MSILPAGVSSTPPRPSRKRRWYRRILKFPKEPWGGSGLGVPPCCDWSPKIIRDLEVCTNRSKNSFDGVFPLVRSETNFWKGRRGYFQVATRITSTATTGDNLPLNRSRDELSVRGSWFSCSEIRLLKHFDDRVLATVFDLASARSGNTEQSRCADRGLCKGTVRGHRSLVDTGIKDEDALMLTAAIQTELLSRRCEAMSPAVRDAWTTYREIEDTIPVLIAVHPVSSITLGSIKPFTLEETSRDLAIPFREGFSPFSIPRRRRVSRHLFQSCWQLRSR